MSTLDVVTYAGEEFGGQKPANFLDIGGGASAQVMADGLVDHPRRPEREVGVREHLRRHHRVRRGRERHRAGPRLLEGSASKPLVVRLDGNNVVEGRRILQEAALPVVHLEETMDGAARRAAELASTAV